MPVLLLVCASCRSDTTAPATSGPPDIASSTVSVTAATVASGDSVTLMLSVRDVRGRPVDGTHAVVFQATGGTATGIVGPVTYRGAGVHAAPFTGIRAGTATTIGATIDGASITTPLPTVRVRPGRFSPTTSVVTVSPRTLTVGRRATLTLSTRDAVGNALEAGGLPVVMRATGGSSQGDIDAVVDNGDGTFSALFTATAVGSPIEIETQVDGIRIGTPSPTLTVARGVSVDHSVVEVSSDTVMFEAGVLLTLEVRDSANVRRTTGGDTVHFIALNTTNGNSETIVAVTDHDDGSYSATYVAPDAGIVLQIAALLNGRATRTTSPTVTIIPVPLAAQTSTVSVSASRLVAGTSATFRVVLRDLNGKPFTRGGHTVRFTIASDGPGAGTSAGSSAGTIGATESLGDGQYSASFRAERSGTAVIVGATIDQNTEIQMLDSLGASQLPVLQVIPGTASLDSSLVTASPRSISIGDTATLQVVARDIFGNAVGSGGQLVTFARTGGAAVSGGRIGDVRDVGDGTYTAFYVGESPGSPDVVRATIDGRVLAGTSAVTVTRECTAGPVSPDSSQLVINDLTPEARTVKSLTLPSGVTTTLTLYTRDSHGCPVRSAHTVTFGIAGGTSTGTLGEVVRQGDGTYTARLTGDIAGTATLVTARLDGVAVRSGGVAVTVAPGDISPRTSRLTVSDSVVAPADTVHVTLIARDIAGNRIRAGGRQVTFLAGPTGCGDLGPTTDLGDGRYTALFVGRQRGAACTVRAFIDRTPVVQTMSIRVSHP